VVGEHKGHRISDHLLEPQNKIDPTVKKKLTLNKKIEASIQESEIFEDDIIEIEEQLMQEQENTISELDEKLELMVEMLKNRKDTLAKAVKQHYKKQEIFLMEAKKNVERRKTNLTKVQQKIMALQEGKIQNDSKIERMEEEFLNINKTFDSPFH
jgi:Fe-S-cluster formation regulator IscX/YfhJ